MYLFKVNNRNIAMCEISSELTIKTSVTSFWCLIVHSGFWTFSCDVEIEHWCEIV